MTTLAEYPEVGTIEEAAEILRLTVRVVSTLTRTRKLGSLKTGRVVTVPRTAIEKYIADNMTEALPPNPFGLTDRSYKRLHQSS